jgi:Ca2+/Na+ antiporter
MNTAHITTRIVPAPSRDAFVAGYYLLTILTGVFVLFFRDVAVDLVAAIFYLAVTVMLYLFSSSKRKEATGKSGDL